MWDLQPTLIGSRVRLEPLAPQHRDDLFAVAGPPEIWDYWSINPGASKLNRIRLGAYCAAAASVNARTAPLLAA